MVRVSRARASVVKTPWPTKIRFRIVKDLERSGVRWFPTASWLRRFSGIPNQAPSMGAKGGTVECRKADFIDVVIVGRVTGAPEEMTPAELYPLLQTGTLSLLHKIEGWEELLKEGSSQSNNVGSAVRLIAPIHKSQATRYEEAAPIGLTQQGIMNRDQIAEVADFTPLGSR